MFWDCASTTTSILKKIEPRRYDRSEGIESVGLPPKVHSVTLPKNLNANY